MTQEGAETRLEQKNSLEYLKSLQLRFTEQQKSWLLSQDFEYTFRTATSQEEVVRLAIFLIENGIDALTVCDDQEVINKWRSLGLTNHSLKWITPLDTIIDELLRLTFHDAIRADAPSAFVLILLYLHKSFRIALLEDIGYLKDKGIGDFKPNQLEKMFQDLYRFIKRKEANPNVRWSDFQLLAIPQILEINEKLEHLGRDPDDFKREILKSARGNNATSLSQIAGCFYTERSKEELAMILFPLFKLLLKDQPLMTREEFETSPSEHDGLTYEAYQYQALKLYLK
jgi:hypothetical protein